MKNLVLSTAVAAAILSGAANATPAIDANNLPVIDPADTNIVYLSGASAARKFIEELLTNSSVPATEALCDQTKPIWKYKDSVNGKKQNAYLCDVNTANPALAAVAKPHLLLFKRSEGGSAQGVSPIVAEAKGAASAIEFLKVAAAPFCSTSLTGLPAVGTLGSITCDYDLADVSKHVSVTPDFGISDVDPGQFKAQNTPAGFDPVSATDVGLLNVQGTASLVFGIPVTTGLRNALQEAQIATGAIDGSCAVGDETEACMPSLSTHQIASIYSGQLESWNQLVVDTTTGAGLFSFASTKPLSDRVHICRRVNGSGTQAQHGIKFLNTPCNAAAQKPATSTFGTPEFVPTVQVHENSSSGDVTDCLNALETGSDIGDFNFFAFNGQFGIPAGPRWAVGIQSLEKNAGLGDDFRFIKVDGVAPTLENVANGTYKDWVELTFQYSLTHGWAGDNKAIADAVIASAGNPVVMSALNGSFNHSFGQSGLLAVPTQYPAAAFGALDLNAPVNPYTHATAFSGADNCRVPAVLPGSSMEM